MKPSSNAVGREAARKVHKNGSFLTPVSSRCSLQDHHTIQTLMKWDQSCQQKSAWVFHLIEQFTSSCNAFLFVEKNLYYLTENRWSQALNSLTTSNCQLLLGLMRLHAKNSEISAETKSEDKTHFIFSFKGNRLVQRLSYVLIYIFYRIIPQTNLPKFNFSTSS